MFTFLNIIEIWVKILCCVYLFKVKEDVAGADDVREDPNELLGEGSSLQDVGDVHGVARGIGSVLSHFQR